MALIKRSDNELDWPHWLSSRRWPDWPALMSEAAERAEMKVEEYRDNGELVIRAEMAGIDPDRDVEITTTDHTLRISAERRQESTTKDKQGYRSEFSYGSFTRTLALPAGATRDDVKATYSDGILEIRVPIDDREAGAKKIPITRT